MQFLTQNIDLLTAYNGIYQPTGLFLSSIIAVLTAYACLSLADRIRAAATPRTKYIWMAVGSIAVATGLQAVQFLIVLAHKLPIPIQYDRATTELSLLPNLIAAVAMLHVLSKQRISILQLLAGAATLSAGFTVGHIVGMEGLIFEGKILYDPLGFAFVLATSIVLSVLVLTTDRLVRSVKMPPFLYPVVAAMLIGVLFSGMQYICMSATHFLPNHGVTIDIAPSNAPLLTTITASIASTILIIAIFAALMETRMRRVSSALKSNKTALGSSEAWLKAIMNGVIDAIITIDPSGSVTTFNPGAENMFGFSAEEIIGESVSRLMTTGDAAAHDRYLQAFSRSAKKGRVMGASRDLIGRRKDGTQLNISLSTTEVKQDGQRIFVGVCRDVTQQRKAEAELEQHHTNLESLLKDRTTEIRKAMTTLESEVKDRQRAENDAQVANRAKSEFLANMSHELRTPLNAILGFAEIIEGRMLGNGHNEKYQEYAGDIRDSGEHLLRIINDILDLSKIEAGEMELDESVIVPAGLVNSCVRLTRERAEAAGLTLRVSSDLPPIILHGDERKLKQILINLLSNSIKFTESGGKVDITTRLDEAGDLLLLVEDTGIGISVGDTEKILSPFGQVDSSLGRATQGTGLGLPLVKSLVELHGGAFEIDSEPGKGTRATVRLPAKLMERLATRSAG